MGMRGPRAVSAKEAFDHRPTEWTNVVRTRRSVMRVAENIGFRLEGPVASDLKEDLLVVAERQARGRIAPGIERWRQADVVAGKNARRSRNNDDPGADCPSRGLQNNAPFIQLQRFDGRSKRPFGQRKGLTGKHLPAQSEKAMEINRADAAELVDARDLKSYRLCFACPTTRLGGMAVENI
jgi:hypothetical protein